MEGICLWFACPTAPFCQHLSLSIYPSLVLSPLSVLMGWLMVTDWTMIASMCHPPSHSPNPAILLWLRPHVWGPLVAWIDLLKGLQWMREARCRLALVCTSIPFFRGTLHGGELPASPLLPTYPSPPPRRDNQAYVKTTCSFDSHQLISDPIKTQIRHCSPLKVSQIRLCRREGLRSLSCQSLLTFLPLLPWPGVRGWENREHELTRGEWRRAKGGTLHATAPLVSQRRG